MSCWARGWGVLVSNSAISPRLSPKRRQDGPKGSSARSSRSPSSPSPSRSASPHQNGHKGSAQNGRHSHGTPLPEPVDVRRLFLDHPSLPSPPPSAGPPHPSSPLPSFPARSAAPSPSQGMGGIWGTGCTPQHPPTFHWVPAHHLRAANRSPPPPEATHRSADVTPPGMMARQASVTCQGHHQAQHLPGSGFELKQPRNG